jgi:membrane fusion protein, multidrug efflux system
MSKVNVRQNSSKRWVLWLTVVTPIIALVCLMSAAGSGQISHPPVDAKLHQVDVIRAQLQDHYLQQHEVVGRVETNQIASLGFELAGSVKTILVDEGNVVAQGQILATLDTQRLDATMQELNASLQRAQADARLAQLSQQRVADLVSRKLEPAQRLDEVRQGSIAANALVTEIIARQHSLQVQLDKSQLLAPFAGTVMSRPVDFGTVVAAGQPVFVLQQTASLDVRFALSTDDAFSLNLGEHYQLSHDQHKINAVLKAIVPQRRMDTRTIDALFSLTDNSKNLLQGDLLSLSFDRTIQARGMWIPRQALTNGIRGLWTLYVVEDDQQGQHISSKAVQVLYSDSEHAFIDGAIAEGDLLVVNGAQRLVPQQLVKANVIGDAILARL